jgi:hypothetical protein
MGNLFFKVYSPAGLNNCRMSLEIGVGLAHLTGYILVPYCVRPAWSSDPLLHIGKDYSRPSTVLDLFEIPVPVDSRCAHQANIRPPGARRLLCAAVWDSVLRVDPAVPEDPHRLRAFRNGRKYISTLDVGTVCTHDLVVDVETLGMYSCFFYGAKSVRSDLIRILGRVRPKAPYRNLAARIAKSLAPFNAIHIRRGDFCYVGQSPRAHNVTGKEILRNLVSRISGHDRLLICTDSSCKQGWFAPLNRHFRDIVYLDRLILGSDRWCTEFRALPHHDDTVLGLVSQLVAAQAECFLGTLFSSFTALIQRSRGLAGKPEFLFCYNDWDSKLVRFERCEFVPVQDGPFSWNRTLYPVYPNVFSWFREWPEAYEQSLSVTGDGQVAALVVLRAEEASIHGRSLQYEQTDDWNDNVGYWTDRRDYLSWDFTMARHVVCYLEARYACPDECAGSRYTIEVAAMIVYTGRVAATGDWALFSSWQRLTRITLAPGNHTLTVRVAEMAGYAAMNLAGIRLVPICE